MQDKLNLMIPGPTPVPENVLSCMSKHPIAHRSGEFQEIVKKVLFQGKELHDQTKFHMKRELGDILWYWINACRALGLNPDDVVLENVEKLKSRYPEGEFSAFHSENRKKGDL